MYARTYSKDSISSFIISAWKMSGEPAIPLAISYTSIYPKGNDRADFGCIWIQSNGIVTHVKIKGCCKSEVFKLLQYRAYFWDWKGFSN